MKRVLVLGCAGSGKSTFAKNLGQVLNLPVFHLDQYFWQPGWVESDRPKFNATVADIARQESWIIDGNYKGSLPTRLAYADKVILLQIPRFRCLLNVLSRTFRYRGRTREDMTMDCPERIEWEFLKFIWTYNSQYRPALEEILNEHEVETIRLDSHSQANTYLASL